MWVRKFIVFPRVGGGETDGDVGVGVGLFVYSFVRLFFLLFSFCFLSLSLSLSHLFYFSFNLGPCSSLLFALNPSFFLPTAPRLVLIDAGGFLGW